MPQVTPKLKEDPDNRAAPASNVLPLAARDAAGSSGSSAQKLTNASPPPQRKSNQPLFPASTAAEGQRLQVMGPDNVKNMLIINEQQVDKYATTYPDRFTQMKLG